MKRSRGLEKAVRNEVVFVILATQRAFNAVGGFTHEPRVSDAASLHWPYFSLVLAVIGICRMQSLGENDLKVSSSQISDG
jgi:hypothetical protein